MFCARPPPPPPPLSRQVCTASRWDCEGWTDVTLAVDGRAGQVPLEYNERKEGNATNGRRGGAQ